MIAANRAVISAAIVLAVSSACGRSAATPAPSVATGSRVVRTQRVVVRDSTGRVLPTGSSIDRDANSAIEVQNSRVRVLRVIPGRLIARFGDTLVPAIALSVSGLDATGATIPRVVPLFGPFRRDGLVKPLGDGRWLATRPGRDTVVVRVMRVAQQPSNDSALVRSVVVEVVR